MGKGGTRSNRSGHKEKELGMDWPYTPKVHQQYIKTDPKLELSRKTQNRKTEVDVA